MATETAEAVSQTETSPEADQAAKDEARYAAAMAAVAEPTADPKDEPKEPEQADPGDETAKDKAKPDGSVAVAKDDGADREKRYDAEVELAHVFGAEFVRNNLKDLSTDRLVAMATEYKPRREKMSRSFQELKQKTGYTQQAARDNAGPQNGSRTTRVTDDAGNPSHDESQRDAFEDLETLDPEVAKLAKAKLEAERQTAAEAKSSAEKAMLTAQVFAAQSAIEWLRHEHPEIKDPDVLNAVLERADKKDPDKKAAQSALEDGGEALRALFKFAAETVIPKKPVKERPRSGSVDVQTRAAGSKALTQAQRDELRYKAAIESGGDGTKAKELLSKWTG